MLDKQSTTELCPQLPVSFSHTPEKVPTLRPTCSRELCLNEAPGAGCHPASHGSSSSQPHLGRLSPQGWHHALLPG